MFLYRENLSALWEVFCLESQGQVTNISEKEDTCWTKESYVVSLVYVNVPYLPCLFMKTPACSVTSTEYRPDR